MEIILFLTNGIENSDTVYTTDICSDEVEKFLNKPAAQLVTKRWTQK